MMSFLSFVWYSHSECPISCVAVLRSSYCHGFHISHQVFLSLNTIMFQLTGNCPKAKTSLLFQYFSKSCAKCIKIWASVASCVLLNCIGYNSLHQNAKAFSRANIVLYFSWSSVKFTMCQWIIQFLGSLGVIYH